MRDRLRIAALSLLAAGTAASFVQPYLSLAAVIPGIALLFSRNRRARRMSDRLERDSMAFLKALASSASRPFSRRVAEASMGCCFERDVKAAIDSYYSCADASGFLDLLGLGSDCLSETVLLLMDALDNGSNVDRQLSELLRQREYGAELRMRHTGSVANSASLVQLGNAVFFPAFAGICRNIASMSLFSSGSWQLSLPFSIVILSYIAIVSAVQAFFQGKRHGRLGDAVAMFCIGACVFNFVGSVGSLIV